MIERFSKRDARSFKKFINGVNKYVDPIIGHLYTPPSETAEAEFNTLMSRIPEIPSNFSEMTGYDLVEHLFESDQVRAAFAGFGLAITPNPRETYSGAIGVFAGITASSGVQSPFTARGGSFNVPFSLANCLLAHGGMILENCEVEKILIKDGEAYGVLLSENSSYPHKIVKARRAVVSNLTAVPTFMQLVGKEHLDTPTLNALKSFDYGGQTLFTMVYTLNDIIRWDSRKWDPNVLGAYWFHYGAESLNQVREHEEMRQNGKVADPIVAVGGSYLFTIRDRMQAPKGMHTVTSWINVPFRLNDGGAGGWADYKESLGEKVTSRIEQYASGFRKSVIAAVPYSPLEIFQRNPSAIEANFAGGNPKVGQFYLDRPFRGCGAPRTPIKKLYISNSIWPFSGTHLTTGYIAACVVAEDLGVRNQHWWSHKPLTWFRKWVKKQSGREWSPFVTTQ